MPRARWVCPFGLLFLLLLVAAARADPPWSEVGVVPGEAPTMAEAAAGQMPATVAVTSLGRTVLGVGRSLTPLLDGSQLGPTVTRPAAGVRITDIVGYGANKLLAVGATTNADALWTLESRPVVAFGTADGRLGAPRSLGDGRDDSGVPVAVAVNRAGASVLAVRSITSVTVYVRRPRGSFRRAFALSGVRSFARPAVAINRRGDALVAWSDERSIYARNWPAGGRPGNVQRLGPTHSSGYVSAAIDEAGRQAAVAWTSQGVNEGTLMTPITVALAYASRRGIFGRRQILESVPRPAAREYVPYPGLEVAFARGRGAVAWTGVRDGGFVVRAADIADGDVAGVQEVSIAPSAPVDRAVFSDLAVGARGGVIVAWGGATTSAAVRGPSAARFGLPERIAVPLDMTDATAPRLAVDPVSGRVVAIWGAWPTMLNPFRTENRVRYAGRPRID